MNIPKKCPRCGSTKVHTETGRDISRYFDNGKHYKTTDVPFDRRVFCDGCYYEF
jgi:hypothetical protein